MFSVPKRLSMLLTACLLICRFSWKSCLFTLMEGSSVVRVGATKWAPSGRVISTEALSM